MTVAQSGSAILRPRARMLRTLGDELISSEKVAILELVKNAYDADATRVLIRFSGRIDIGEGSVEVMDNGQGMSMDIIRTAWMEPATLYKVRNQQSENRKRRVLGAKGIGRFAASKLAEELIVTTRKAEATYETTAVFSWSAYDDEQMYLDQIETLWEESQPKEICPQGTIGALWNEQETPSHEELCHGTILKMERLSSTWTKKMVEELRTALRRLISPFFVRDAAAKNDEFRIFLVLPAPYQDYSGEVQAAEQLKFPPYTLECLVDEQGNYDLVMKIKGQEYEVKRSFVREEDRGRPPEDCVPLGCGPFFFELRVWDREPRDLEELAKEYGSTVRQIRQDLDLIAGVSIYRDGFRILPYGEPENDWLRLDHRRVQNPTMRLSNNQIVGYVLISADDNKRLQDQSNREGLVNSPALRDLRELIVAFIAQLEPLRYNARRAPKPDVPAVDRQKSLFADFDLTSVYNLVKTRHPDDAVLLDEVERTGRELTRQKEQVREVVARYHRLATLGQLYDTILHEGQTPLGKIINEAVGGQRAIQRADGKDASGLVNRLSIRLEEILKHARYLKKFFDNISPFGGRKRGQPEESCIETLITATFETLESDIRRLGVECTLPDTRSMLQVVPEDIQVIILNLLRNSLYWLTETPQEQRQIVVQMSQSDPDEVDITFSDSGPGVPPEIRDSIFDAYFTTRPGGTGLGLTIAGETASEFYQGELTLLAQGLLPGATFHITLHGWK